MDDPDKKNPKRQAKLGVKIVFPNPSTGLLNIKLLDSDSQYLAKLIVQDLKGNFILNQELELIGTKTLDLSHLPPSVYLLNIYINNTNFTRQIVIK